MEYQEVYEKLKQLTSTECFYREYYRAKQDPQRLAQFLASLDKEEVLAMDCWLPELEMKSTGYISEFLIYDLQKNIEVHKHNRYNPLFRHKHAFFEMIYVLEGSCVNTVEEQPLLMKKQDICILAPDVSHSLSVFDDDSIVLNILIRKSTFKETFFDLFTDDAVLSLFFTHILYGSSPDSYVYFPGAKDERTTRLLEYLIEEGFSSSKYSKQAMENLLRSIFCFLMEKGEDAVLSDYNTKQLPEIVNMIRYMQTHYNTITIQRLADEFSYSPNYIGKLIKKQTGSTFIAILQDIRLKKACDMLQSTNMQINHIGILVGYDSIEFFNRIFKREYGMTPTEYRQLRHQWTTPTA